MSDCCSTDQKDDPRVPKKSPCPSCETLGALVSTTTMQQQLISPWTLSFNHTLNHPYYFCNSRDCDTVYFNDNKSIFNTDSIRVKIGIKSSSDDALICYCFGVSKEDAKDASIKSYVTAKTKAKECDCSNRNPSGRCCLKDFPK